MRAGVVGALAGVALSWAGSQALALTVLPLESRLGGLAYYDPNLNITWAADANINGQTTWDNQMTWVSTLTIGGVSGWRLPSINVDGDSIIV